MSVPWHSRSALPSPLNRAQKPPSVPQVANFFVGVDQMWKLICWAATRFTKPAACIEPANADILRRGAMKHARTMRRCMISSMYVSEPNDTFHHGLDMWYCIAHYTNA